MEHRIEITDQKTNEKRVYNGILIEERMSISPRGVETTLVFYDTARFRDLYEIPNQNREEEILL